MKVTFAPDWRDGVPYQKLLAEALVAQGVAVDYLRDYRRLLPLTRGLANRDSEILHLHWPEAYYARRGDRLDLLRRARFGTDLSLATRRRALVVTAHNLHTHNRAGELLEHHNYRTAMRQAQAVIAHSAAARDALLTHFGLSPDRIHVIPHGDLSVVMPRPNPAPHAEKLCLIFGTVEPYKGLEELLQLWHSTQPDARLAIVGRPIDETYARVIQTAAAVAGPRVELHLHWLSDAQLAEWLTAANVVLFNYRAIFTSGAATLARSWGVPILLPERLKTIDLGEPSDRVFRFTAETFAVQLRAALKIPANFEAAAPWRAACAWPRLAEMTKAVYAKALE